MTLCSGSTDHAVRTWYAAIGNAQKLVVTTRVTEESRVDGHRTARLAGARPIQREMDVDITVASVRDVTTFSNKRMIASVTGTVKHYDTVGVTDDLQYCVETDEVIDNWVVHSASFGISF
jgi:hypothetical protein